MKGIFNPTQQAKLALWMGHKMGEHMKDMKEWKEGRDDEKSEKGEHEDHERKD
jgi:hypothetical protein